MDPFHVVRLAPAMSWTDAASVFNIKALIPAQMVRDPLYATCRTLHTGHDLLNAKQETGWRPCSPYTTMPISKRRAEPTSVSTPPTAILMARAAKSSCKR